MKKGYAVGHDLQVHITFERSSFVRLQWLISRYRGLKKLERSSTPIFAENDRHATAAIGPGSQSSAPGGMSSLLGLPGKVLKTVTGSTFQAHTADPIPTLNAGKPTGKSLQSEVVNMLSLEKWMKYYAEYPSTDPFQYDGGFAEVMWQRYCPVQVESILGSKRGEVPDQPETPMKGLCYACCKSCKWPELTAMDEVEDGSRFEVTAKGPHRIICTACCDLDLAYDDYVLA